MEGNSNNNIDEIEIRKFLKAKQCAKDSLPVKQSNKECDHDSSIIDHHSGDIICTLCGLVLVERLSYEEIYYKI